MRKNVLRYAAAALILLTGAALFADPPEASVSEKQALAVFALGYYGYDIPDEALGSIDAKIIDVFTRMKRFSIMGFDQRFSSADVGQFIEDLKKIKEENLVIPEKYLLGEAFLTEAEMNKLIGSFYIVMPVVTSFSVKYVAGNKDKKASWNCTLDVAITFQDVAEGVTMAAPVISASGSSPESRERAAAAAIDSIPGSLEVTARKVFPLDSKIVSASLTGVKMRLGSSMGIKKGYEFAVIERQEIDGIVDERESGLIVVNKVTSEFSDATILYSSIPLAKETQLREIPRAGTDISAYTTVLVGAYPIVDFPSRGGIFCAPGLKATLSEGFYAFKPFFGVQTYLPGFSIIGNSVFIPASFYLGGELNLYLRRLQVYPFLAIGGNCYYVQREEESEGRFLLSHVGGLGGLGVSYLAGKSFKVYVEANGQYWLTLSNVVDSFLGAGANLGVTIKL